MMSTNAGHFGQSLHALFSRIHKALSGGSITVGEISSDAVKIGNRARSIYSNRGK